MCFRTSQISPSYLSKSQTLSHPRPYIPHAALDPFNASYRCSGLHAVSTPNVFSQYSFISLTEIKLIRNRQACTKLYTLYLSSTNKNVTDMQLSTFIFNSLVLLPKAQKRVGGRLRIYNAQSTNQANPEIASPVETYHLHLSSSPFPSLP